MGDLSVAGSCPTRHQLAGRYTPVLMSALTMNEAVAMLVTVWAGMELLFYFVIFKDWLRSMDFTTPTPTYRLDPEVLITNVLNDVHSLQNYSVTRFLSGWFLGASLDEVKLGETGRFSL